MQNLKKKSVKKYSSYRSEMVRTDGHRKVYHNTPPLSCGGYNKPNCKEFLKDAASCPFLTVLCKLLWPSLLWCLVKRIFLWIICFQCFVFMYWKVNDHKEYVHIHKKITLVRKVPFLGKYHALTLSFSLINSPIIHVFLSPLLKRGTTYEHWLS